MKTMPRLVLFAALLALGVWLWTFLFPSPEKIIRKRLSDVARSASFAPNEGPLAKVANVQTLVSCFSPDISVNIDLPGHEQHTLSGHDEITQAAMAARSALNALEVEFLDLNITLDADKQTAVVNLTARAKVPAEKDFMVEEMKFTLKKINGEWLITRVETVKTLSRGPRPVPGRSASAAKGPLGNSYLSWLAGALRAGTARVPIFGQHALLKHTTA